MVSYVLSMIFFGFAVNASPVTPKDQYEDVIDTKTLQTIQRKAKFMAGLLQSKEAIEEALFQEMLATHIAHARIQTLTHEKILLEEDKSIVLAGTLIEKLGQKYGGKLKNATRREEWLYILEHCNKEKPIQFIRQKIQEVGLTYDEFVALIMEVSELQKQEIHKKMLERTFRKTLMKFRSNVPECILWCVETLLGAYSILKYPTAAINITSNTTTTTTAVH